MTNQEASNPFVLLLGPSGTGKSSIIRNLREVDERIIFVSPMTDRPLRAGEKDKISVETETFTDLMEQHIFLVVNQLYGYRYGTPRTTINSIIEDGGIPIMDFPLAKMPALAEYESIIYSIYVVPPTLSELKRRLDADGRSKGNTRFEEAKKELLELGRIHFRHQDIQAVIINRDLDRATQEVYSLIQRRIKRD